MPLLAPVTTAVRVRPVLVSSVLGELMTPILSRRAVAARPGGARRRRLGGRGRLVGVPDVSPCRCRPGRRWAAARTGRDDQPAHVAARPARHRRRRRDERLRRRAGEAAGRPGRRRRGLHPGDVLDPAADGRGVRGGHRAPRARGAVRGADQGRAPGPAVRLRPRGAAGRGPARPGLVRRRAHPLLALRPGRRPGARPVERPAGALHAHHGQGEERLARRPATPPSRPPASSARSRSSRPPTC